MAALLEIIRIEVGSFVLQHDHVVVAVTNVEVDVLAIAMIDQAFATLGGHGNMCFDAGIFEQLLDYLRQVVIVGVAVADE
jgi:predicted homoserine dehydrogenase-like protein